MRILNADADEDEADDADDVADDDADARSNRVV